MKRILLVTVAVAVFGTIAIAQNVAINNTGTKPDNSAMLDVQSTSKGMLIPRMSTAQRNAIISPAKGLLVFDNTTSSFWFKGTTGWTELIDSTNTIWTKKDTSVYLNNNENVGIGVNTPAVRLQVDRGTDVTAAGGGYLQLGASSNPNLAFDNNEIQARDNGFFSDLSLQANGGNVGIGTKKPEVRLQVSNGTDVSTAGGYFQIGIGTLANLAFDNNEIQARNDSKPSTLFLQNSGGNVQLGSATSQSNLSLINGKLIKPNTGVYNMMPLCYGKIAANGKIISATPNVSVVKSSQGPGIYYIYCDEITSATILSATSNETTGSVAVNFIKAGEVGAVFTYSDGTAGNAVFSFIFYNP